MGEAFGIHAPEKKVMLSKLLAFQLTSSLGLVYCSCLIIYARVLMKPVILLAVDSWLLLP